MNQAFYLRLHRVRLRLAINIVRSFLLTEPKQTTKCFFRSMAASRFGFFAKSVRWKLKLSKDKTGSGLFSQATVFIITAEAVGWSRIKIMRRSGLDNNLCVKPVSSGKSLLHPKTLHIENLVSIENPVSCGNLESSESLVSPDQNVI